MNKSVTNEIDEAIAASSGSVRDALNIALAEVGQLLLQRVAELETELARSREMCAALFEGSVAKAVYDLKVEELAHASADAEAEIRRLRGALASMEYLDVEVGRMWDAHAEVGRLRGALNEIVSLEVEQNNSDLQAIRLLGRTVSIARNALTAGN